MPSSSRSVQKLCSRTGTGLAVAVQRTAFLFTVLTEVCSFCASFHPVLHCTVLYLRWSARSKFLDHFRTSPSRCALSVVQSHPNPHPYPPARHTSHARPPGRLSHLPTEPTKKPLAAISQAKRDMSELHCCIFTRRMIRRVVNASNTPPMLLAEQMRLFQACRLPQMRKYRAAPAGG